MPLTTLDPFIRHHYEVHEWRHARATLAADFPNELADIQAVLMQFRLRKIHILVPGGGKSEISRWIDGELTAKGWRVRKCIAQIKVDDMRWTRPRTRSIASRIGLGCKSNGTTTNRSTAAL